MIKLYERLNYPVNEQLIRQYLQNPKIAKSFAVYYDLFLKYRSDYQIDEILKGTQSKAIESRAGKAKFDERLSLLSLLLDAVSGDLKDVITQEDKMKILMETIRGMKSELIRVTGEDADNMLLKATEKLGKEMEKGRKSGVMSAEAAAAIMQASSVMLEMGKQIKLKNPKTGTEAFGLIKEIFDAENGKLKGSAKAAKQKLENMFAFCEKVFPDGQELLILVTELTIRPHGARFIGKYGCDAYFRHNKNLLFYERKTEILQQIQNINLDD